MSSKPVRVLIADDSIVYRSQIKAALKNIAWIEVVGTASNGRLALERLQQASVDLLILDLEMPEMDGLQVLSALRSWADPCRTLVFSSASRAGADVTLKALALGAVDFLMKPGPEELVSGTKQPVDPSLKIRALLEPKISALFPRVGDLTPDHGTGRTYPKIIWEFFAPEIVVIGSSTGGPTVLEGMFARITGPLSCPILITQHMPPLFTTALAERLQRISGIRTKEAAHGEILEANTVYLAPGGYHMSVAGAPGSARIVLDQDPPVHFVRPAVDPLFFTAAKVFGDKCLGIVLTGMGVDGKAGAEAVKSSGGAVLIQSESTCVVFGMPGAIHAAGAFDRILSPSEIAAEIQNKTASFPSARQKAVSGET